MIRVREILKANRTAAILVSFALILLAFGSLLDRFSSRPEVLAHNLEKKIEKKLGMLDKFVKEEIEEKECQWDHPENFPEDMVLYRYEFDSLCCWHNDFPVINDEIRRSGLSNSIVSNPTSGYSQPLANLDTTYRFTNIGSKWYVAKLVRKDIRTTVIAALEICSQSLNGDMENMSEDLKMPEGVFITLAGQDGGHPVFYNDNLLFLINCKTTKPSSLPVSLYLRWTALALIILAALLVHRKKRSFVTLGISAGVFTFTIVSAIIWGSKFSGSLFFSPSIYASGSVLSSLGNLLLLNVLIILAVIIVYMTRASFLKRARKRGKIGTRAYAASLAICIIALLTYSILTAINLIMNSSMELSLNFTGGGNFFTILSIAVYATLLSITSLLVEMMLPLAPDIIGKRIPPLTARKMTMMGLVYALLFSLAFCIFMNTLGFEKEKSRAEVWANRMAIDRDLQLEIELRSQEEKITSDNLISLLSDMGGSAVFIKNRITDAYLVKAAQNYDINVSVCPENDKRMVKLFTDKILSGTQIADGSRFYYTYNANGHSTYTGMFVYFTPKKQIVRVLVELESIANRDNRDFLSIFNDDALHYAGIDIPSDYSYAKYVESRLVSFRGSYAYPTILEGIYKDILEKGKDSFTAEGYLHFPYVVADGEIILISRPFAGLFQAASTFLLVAMVAFLCTLPYLLEYRKDKRTPRNSFKRRVSRSLLISFIISLTFLVGVSVRFVFERNIADSETMISDRINTIQTLIEAECRNASSYRDLSTGDFRSAIEAIGKNTRSDITLFTPEGKVFISTVPEIYDRMLVSTRMNGDAYYSITKKHQRFFKHKEVYNGRKFIALYAPIFNADGTLTAILSTPFTNRGSIMREAIPHAILLAVIALMLIVVCQIFISRYTDRMFGPLSQVSDKMSRADLHNLEYISYSPNDEVSSLVEAYNRMVRDLSESTRQLAQNERNKAWSEMARQVAHEIKNPLTPIKLEIQRLIRLKQRNDPSWSEKFDHVADIVLEHIDILSDTANEFSTFAKLYAEEPVELDLDKMLQDQIVLFDNKENISITYMGLSGALIMGPKPQLIRVFVNLITNAVQAIEITQKESQEKGEVFQKGEILVCLRNSSIDADSYDVVIEDNGPGVSDENMEKIFQPNFTTKRGGTGLGLAICNSIIEKCEGSIRYKKSYSLGGACFTVNLPKKAQQ